MRVSRVESKPASDRACAELSIARGPGPGTLRSVLRALPRLGWCEIVFEVAGHPMPIRVVSLVHGSRAIWSFEGYTRCGQLVRGRYDQRRGRVVFYE